MLADFLPQFHEAAPIIISLIIIEGLLSVDNMLAIAALASNLPEAQKRTALRLGLIGAYVFRAVALLGVSFIISNPWLKILGAAYLIHLMAQHFSDLEAETDDDPATHAGKHTFWGTVIAIQFMDLSLSVDNVVAAVAMSPNKLWVVYAGVFLGLFTLWLLAGVSLKMVERFPILAHAAFLLIGFVGASLLIEISADLWWHVHLHFGPLQKFAGIVIILLASLAYASSAQLQKLCVPLFKIIMLPMHAYAKLAGAILAALLWPFKKVAGSLR
jgi:YkoY family integral membrane protein